MLVAAFRSSAPSKEIIVFTTYNYKDYLVISRTSKKHLLFSLNILRCLELWLVLLAGGLLLSGCSSLPPLYAGRHDQDMMREAEKGRIVATGGELMGAMREPIDARLSRMNGDGALDRQRAVFEAVSQVTTRGGHDAHIWSMALPHGMQFLQRCARRATPSTSRALSSKSSTSTRDCPRY